MQRQTPLDSSFRAYVSGGARGCAHEADDKKLLQEVKINFMKDETRDKVEHPQPYGFTGYFVKAEYEDNGEIKKCAEHFTQFMGGNRSFPVCAVLDDRRYRLRNFKEGETAVYDDQQQKVHLQRERVYVRSMSKVEMRVIKDQPKMEGHGKDQEADRDQQKDKSRRWSTWVMDKDHILIERTDVVNDDDDKDKKTQDEPGGEPPTALAYDKHIKLLSRVHLDAMHVQVNTPNISILWDEEKHKLVINTEFTSITLDDGEQKDKKEITVSAPLTVTLKTPTTSVILDEEAKLVTLKTPNTAVVLDEEAKVVKVGDETAVLPAACYKSVTTAGGYVFAKLARKVVVK